MTKFKDIIAYERPVLVDFFDELCGPCIAMNPILEDLKRRMGNNVLVLKMDVDKNKALSESYGIRSVPTLMVFRNSELKWRHAGILPADKLEEVLNGYMTA